MLVLPGCAVRITTVALLAMVAPAQSLPSEQQQRVSRFRMQAIEQQKEINRQMAEQITERQRKRKRAEEDEL